MGEQNYTLCVFMSVFVVSGGFAAVIYTDSIQTLIIVGGAFSLMFIGTAEVDTQLPALSFPKGSQTSDLSTMAFDSAGLRVLQPSPGWDGTKD